MSQHNIMVCAWLDYSTCYPIQKDVEKIKRLTQIGTFINVSIISANVDRLMDETMIRRRDNILCGHSGACWQFPLFCCSLSFCLSPCVPSYLSPYITPSAGDVPHPVSLSFCYCCHDVADLCVFFGPVACFPIWCLSLLLSRLSRVVTGGITWVPVIQTTRSGTYVNAHRIS